MATVITFLRNYQHFGHKVRAVTAKILYQAYFQNNNDETRKIMFLRLFEENIASAEDLLHWFAALVLREKYPPKLDTTWEFLLSAGINSLNAKFLITETKKTLNVRSGIGLFKKLDIGTLEELESFVKMDKITLTQLLNELLKILKVCIRNRTVMNALLLRAQNKIKHGMVVTDDGNRIYLRDFRVIRTRNGKRIRKNKNLDLRIDDTRAKGFLDTIEANSASVNLIVTLLMFYQGKMIMKLKEKKKLTKTEQQFLVQSLMN